MTWGAAAAKAKFSALLDEADAKGPQLVQRRKQQYFLVTKEQWDQRSATSITPPDHAKSFVSVWDSLRIEPEFQTDEDLFPRNNDEGRIFEL